MQRFPAPLVALVAAASVLLATHPAQAHGLAAGGGFAGLIHPLVGLDHLLMLMAVGAAAVCIAPTVLFWALGGAVIGAALGVAGWTVPAAEVFAALAIAAVGGMILLASQRRAPGGALASFAPLAGAVVASGVALHALLHGLEAPQDASTLFWWSGALVSSALVTGSTVLLLRRLPNRWTEVAAIGFLVLGSLLAVAPLGLFTGGAAAA